MNDAADPYSEGAGKHLDERLNLCRAAPHVFKMGAFDFCKKCGCCLNIKAKFAWSKCPIGKW